MIPAEWLAASFQPAVSLPAAVITAITGIGALLPAMTTRANATGNGGQRLFLLQRLVMAVTVTAGNYDAPGQ